MNHRILLAGWLAAASLAAQAQSYERLAPSRPSTPSTASTGVELGPDGVARSAQPVPAAPARGPAMLGAGAFNSTTGLENAVNSGTPPAWDRKSAGRKVCPPGMENRNNICAAPLGSIISP